MLKKTYCLISMCMVLFVTAHEEQPRFYSAEQMRKLGYVFYNTCQYQQAQSYFEKAKRLVPQELKYHLDLWKTLIQRGEFQAALDLLEQAPEAKDVLSWLGKQWSLGNTYRHLHAFDEAKECFLSIVDSEPIEHMRYSWIVGNAHSALGNYHKAIDCWQTTLTLVPDDEEKQTFVILHRNIGHIAILAKRYQEAIEHLHEAVRLNPHMASSFDSLGTAYRKNDQLKEAADWYEKALQVDPRWGNSISNLGILYRKEGQFERAIDQFEQAIEINEDHYGAHFQLGKTYCILHNKDQALHHLNRALEINAQGGVTTQDKVRKYLEKAQAA